MRQGEAWYFTPAEFELLLDLSDGGPYSVFRTGAAPDDAELVEAFAGLYGRGLLLRSGDAFIPAPEFAAIRAATTAVVIRAERPRSSVSVCYTASCALWLAEVSGDILADRIRLRQTDREGLETWLFDAGILPHPVLTEEDAADLSLLYDDGPPIGKPFFRVEKYQNGGGFLCAWEALEGGGGPLVRRDDGQTQTAAFYTAESLSRMMEECFQTGPTEEGQRDNRQRESSGA